MNRRKFLTYSALAMVSVGFIGCSDNADSAEDSPSNNLNNQNTQNNLMGIMPDESDEHQATWMAFGASELIHFKKDVPKLQEDLARIALAIAEFETVNVLVRQNEMAKAKSLMSHANIVLVEGEMDDFWIRDTGAVFVKSTNKLAGVNFNFNGWGNKQNHNQDKTVAKQLTSYHQIEHIQSSLVLEGGGIEVDGHGTAIITESCVINANRNPNKSKTEIEQELKRVLGIKKVIWLSGIKDHDITDGHTDFYARFVKKGVVVTAYDDDPKSFDHAVTLKHIETLKNATDVDGIPLQVIQLKAPAELRVQNPSDDFAAGYINFYVCNGGVIMPEFGDLVADAEAKSKLRAVFPDRKIVQLNIDAIAAAGGGIHCTTQQVPKV